MFRKYLHSFLTILFAFVGCRFGSEFNTFENLKLHLKDRCLNGGRSCFIVFEIETKVLTALQTNHLKSSLRKSILLLWHLKCTGEMETMVYY